MEIIKILNICEYKISKRIHIQIYGKAKNLYKIPIDFLLDSWYNSHKKGGDTMKEMNNTYLNAMYRDVDHMSRLFSLFTVNSERLCSAVQEALLYEDAKAQDIMHCIELKKLDAVQCAKLCHAL